MASSRLSQAARSFALAGASGLALYSLSYSRPVQLDQPVGAREHDDQPMRAWRAPTRDRMLEALKRNRGLPVEHADLPSANFSGLAEPTDGAADDDCDYDLLIVGGGATGAGCALDAASRGLKVALVERDDFASGTSSKSTKLVHGGVRYLQKAIMELDKEQWDMVREALHERRVFLETAPYLSHELPIMLPVYSRIKLPYYWIGCKMYDLLAGKQNLSSSYLLSKSQALHNFPMLKSDGLVGALVYYDGQHNDARMNLALIMTAVHLGAVTANYTEVIKLHKKTVEGKGERVCGARLRDVLTGEEWDVRAKGVINATGPFADGLRKMDDGKTREIVAPSSGVHVTLPKYYSPGSMGLLDPNTSDGRVIFFLPWLGNAIAGTTDKQAPVSADPIPQEEEIQWILDEVRNYLSPDIQVRRGDVLSAWSGLRPLVMNPKAKNTESLVRNHLIDISPDGLLTIAGGKWTTYRAMAAETIDAAVKAYDLEPKRACVTEHLKLFGSHAWRKNLFVQLIQQYGLETEVAKHLTDTYGDQAEAVCSLMEPTGERWPVHGKRLDAAYPFTLAEIRYACRNELAIRAIDILARRSRLAFLNARAALERLPTVIDIMADELHWDDSRIAAEFEHSRKLLLSFGLEPALAKLSLEDVRAGKSLDYGRYDHEEREDDGRRGKDISLQSNDTARSGGGT